MRLIAEELSGSRGGRSVFSGVGIDLSGGGALVVTGPNGSGKSTLLRVLAGLLPASGGRVRLKDAGDEAGVAGACHYLGHDNAMKAVLTVTENLSFWRSYLGDPRLTVEEALDQVELGGTGSLPFAYLSTGQRRRSAIARLLVSYRPIWLLDEPTAGLDATSEGLVSGLMRKHLREGGILVAATHLALGLEGCEELDMGQSDHV